MSQLLLFAQASETVLVDDARAASFTRPEEVRMIATTRCASVVGLAVALAMTFPHFTSAQTACRSGYVWREAVAGDFVCVSPDTRAQAARDNSEAAVRREPGGGASGPNTCRSGYVWREARPGDVVCVTPEVRAQTARDNAAAASRRTPAAPSGKAPQTAEGYRTSEWSAWTRADGVDYRYRWGWNPQESRYASNVDAIFEMRNRTSRPWRGAARSVDCAQNVLSRSKSVSLRPNETREVIFLTANCGTRQSPWFKPSVVQSVNVD